MLSECYLLVGRCFRIEFEDTIFETKFPVSVIKINTISDSYFQPIQWHKVMCLSVCKYYIRCRRQINMFCASRDRLIMCIVVFNGNYHIDVKQRRYCLLCCEITRGNLPSSQIYWDRVIWVRESWASKGPNSTHTHTSITTQAFTQTHSTPSRPPLYVPI